MQNISIFDLPHNALGEILAFLDIKSIFSLLMSCKLAKNLLTSADTNIWQTFMFMKGLGPELLEISKITDFIIESFIKTVVKHPNITLDHHLRYQPYDKLAPINTLHNFIVEVSKFISENKQQIYSESSLSKSVTFVKSSISNFFYNYLRDFYFNYLTIMRHGDFAQRSKIVLAEDELYIAMKHNDIGSRKFLVTKNDEPEKTISSQNNCLKPIFKKPKFYHEFTEKYNTTFASQWINSIDDLYEYFAIKEKLQENPNDENRMNGLDFDINFIQYINNPTDDEILMYIKQYPLIIQYSLNPSEKLQLTSLKALKKQDRFQPILRYIRKPSIKVIDKAIEYNSDNFQFVSELDLFEVYKYSKSGIILNKLLHSKNKDLVLSVQKYVEDNYNKSMFKAIHPFWPNLVKVILKDDPDMIENMDNEDITKEVFDEFMINPTNMVLMIIYQNHSPVVRENITEDQVIQAILEDTNIISVLDDNFEFLQNTGLNSEEWIIKRINEILNNNNDMSFIEFMRLSCVSLMSLVFGKICLKNESKFECFQPLENTENIIIEILNNVYLYEIIENKISELTNYLLIAGNDEKFRELTDVKLCGLIIEIRKRVVDKYPHFLTCVVKNFDYPPNFANSNDIMEIVKNAVTKYPAIAIVLQDLPIELEIPSTICSKLSNNFDKDNNFNKETKMLNSLLYENSISGFVSRRTLAVNRKLNKEQIETFSLLNTWSFLEDESENPCLIKNIQTNNKILGKLSPNEAEKNKKYLDPKSVSKSYKCNVQDRYISNIRVLDQDKFEKLSPNKIKLRSDLIEKFKTKE